MNVGEDRNDSNTPVLAPPSCTTIRKEITMPCTKTHAEHLATWESWRDDCAGEGGCGFGMQDIEQCENGHPDDGTEWCGACGYDAVYERLKVGELEAIGVKADASGINIDGWSIAETIRAFPLTEQESAEVARRIQEARDRARARWTPGDWARFEAGKARLAAYLEATA